MTLENIELGNKILQILIIKDIAEKPYFLSKQKKGKKTLNAGTIYTRIMDTNTPKNSVASSKNIEYMWKERFGLMQTPFERFKLYLENYSGWDQNKDYVFFYKQNPEFTIKEVENNTYKGHENREWAKGEVGYHYDSGNLTYVLGLYYHATLLKEIIIVNFDGGKKTIVSPTWEPINRGRIYYYLEESIEYIFQKFWAFSHEYKDYSKGLSSESNSYFQKFDIPVFNSQEDLQSFLDTYNINDKNIELEKTKQGEIFYSNINNYMNWKDNNY